MALLLNVGRWDLFGNIWSWRTNFRRGLDGLAHVGTWPLVMMNTFRIHGAFTSTDRSEYFKMSKSLKRDFLFALDTGPLMYFLRVF